MVIILLVFLRRLGSHQKSPRAELWLYTPREKIHSLENFHLFDIAAKQKHVYCIKYLTEISPKAKTSSTSIIYLSELRKVAGPKLVDCCCYLRHWQLSLENIIYIQNFICFTQVWLKNVKSQLQGGGDAKAVCSYIIASEVTTTHQEC